MNYRNTIGSQIIRIAISISLLFSFLISFYANSQAETIPNWISVRHSPFNLVEHPGITNPIITANDVTDVPARFVADPFMFHENNAWFMFFEVYNTNSDKGEIGLATSSNGLNWVYQEIVLAETMHLSYPLILKSNGEYYMIPETHEWYQVRIYKANDFPYDWTYLTSIASGRRFVDPSIFQYNDKWWMFVGGSGADKCYLYYSDNLLSGWFEHPKSPIVNGDASRARPGGRSFVFDTDRIIRIAQKCDISYGEQVRAFEVDILTEDDYFEHEIIESPLLEKSGVGWNAWAMHHFDPWWTGKEWICAVDGMGNSGWTIGIYRTEDAYTCEGKVPTILGTKGHDFIKGTDGPDVIHGLGGNDVINGLGGDDIICGGDGNDTILGRGGNDILRGQNGHDVIWAGDGNDLLGGGEGDDYLDGKAGDDKVYGYWGNDTLKGGDGDDFLHAGAGPDNNDTCYDTAGTVNYGCEVFYEQ